MTVENLKEKNGTRMPGELIGSPASFMSAPLKMMAGNRLPFQSVSAGDFSTVIADRYRFNRFRPRFHLELLPIGRPADKVSIDYTFRYSPVLKTGFQQINLTRFVHTMIRQWALPAAEKFFRDAFIHRTSEFQGPSLPIQRVIIEKWKDGFRKPTDDKPVFLQSTTIPAVLAAPSVSGYYTGTVDGKPARLPRVRFPGSPLSQTVIQERFSGFFSALLRVNTQLLRESHETVYRSITRQLPGAVPFFIAQLQSGTVPPEFPRYFSTLLRVNSRLLKGVPQLLIDIFSSQLVSAIRDRTRREKVLKSIRESRSVETVLGAGYAYDFTRLLEQRLIRQLETAPTSLLTVTQLHPHSLHTKFTRHFAGLLHVNSQLLRGVPQIISDTFTSQLVSTISDRTQKEKALNAIQEARSVETVLGARYAYGFTRFMEQRLSRHWEKAPGLIMTLIGLQPGMVQSKFIRHYASLLHVNSQLLRGVPHFVRDTFTRQLVSTIHDHTQKEKALTAIHETRPIETILGSRYAYDFTRFMERLLFHTWETSSIPVTAFSQLPPDGISSDLLQSQFFLSHLTPSSQFSQLTQFPQIAQLTQLTQTRFTHHFDTLRHVNAKLLRGLPHLVNDTFTHQLIDSFQSRIKKRRKTKKKRLQEKRQQEKFIQAIREHGAVETILGGKYAYDFTRFLEQRLIQSLEPSPAPVFFFGESPSQSISSQSFSSQSFLSQSFLSQLFPSQFVLPQLFSSTAMQARSIQFQFSQTPSAYSRFIQHFATLLHVNSQLLRGVPQLVNETFTGQFIDTIREGTKKEKRLKEKIIKTIRDAGAVETVIGGRYAYDFTQFLERRLTQSLETLPTSILSISQYQPGPLPTQLTESKFTRHFATLLHVNSQLIKGVPQLVSETFTGQFISSIRDRTRQEKQLKEKVIRTIRDAGALETVMGARYAYGFTRILEQRLVGHLETAPLLFSTITREESADLQSKFTRHFGTLLHINAHLLRGVPELLNQTFSHQLLKTIRQGPYKEKIIKTFKEGLFKEGFLREGIFREGLFKQERFNAIISALALHRISIPQFPRQAMSVPSPSAAFTAIGAGPLIQLRTDVGYWTMKHRNTIFSIPKELFRFRSGMFSGAIKEFELVQDVTSISRRAEPPAKVQAEDLVPQLPGFEKERFESRYTVSFEHGKSSPPESATVVDFSKMHLNIPIKSWMSLDADALRKAAVPPAGPSPYTTPTATVASARNKSIELGNMVFKDQLFGKHPIMVHYAPGLEEDPDERMAKIERKVKDESKRLQDKINKEVAAIPKPTPGINVGKMADDVYKIIVERVKSERRMRGY